ncbi:MAG: RelA/SpoT domain-containing protein, partial [Acidimicrobiales bacterium]
MAAQADRTAPAPVAMATDETGPLTYARFGAWYDSHRRSVLEPALEAGLEALGAAIDDGLSDRDRSRIRNLAGRVKSKRRTWRKIRQSQYAETIGTTGDIPAQINDLVGLRITCTNLRDIETVQTMLDALPDGRGRGGGLWVEMDAERDYVRAPKESGYRGWHVPLGIEIDQGGRRVPVICELQVRTLLQDSWGELTHEDTYSKDGELPPLVEVLSKRIADLFATLDDIAEDLRTELDRLDEVAIAEVDEAAPVAAPVDGGGQAADAASMLLDRWHRMDRPIDLASLAWALQTEFGAEVSDDWFGHRSFKRFLTAAVPDGEISTGDQAYLLPPQTPTDDDRDSAATRAGPAPQAEGGVNGGLWRRRIPDEA